MINIFYDMNRHLLQDDTPSDYLKQLVSLPFFKEYPYLMLYRLKETEQSPEHHPEGNVWNHTMLVLDEAAHMKEKSHEEKSFMWAALLHDIGKPDTTKLRKGKITAYDHDKIGYDLSRKFLQELTNEADFVEKTAMLVKWHMQMLFVLKNLPFAETEAMKEQTDVHEVALLGFCDRMGRLNPDREKEENNRKEFLERCM